MSARGEKEVATDETPAKAKPSKTSLAQIADDSEEAEAEGETANPFKVKKTLA